MHPTGPAPGGPRPGERNEFADAVARMFENRQQAAPDFAPPLRDDVGMADDVPVRDEADDWETPRPSILSSILSSLAGASALRRALSIVPLAVVGYAIAWFLYFEPSQDVTAKPIADAKPQVTQPAAPIEPPPPPRPEVVEVKPTPAPPPAAAAPAIAVATPSRPLSKDEIKELQGKLGAAGFAVGPIDGIVGPQTQAALRRYAQSRSLDKPPEPTQETLLRLRSETQVAQ